MFCLELLEADDCEILDETLLDLVEPIMVFIELLARVGEEGAVFELVRGRRDRICC